MSPLSLVKKQNNGKTEYTLHKNYTSASNCKNVIDFSEMKLRKLLTHAGDEQQRKVLSNLINDYINGDVIIAWRSGMPLFMTVTKGK